RKLLNSDHPWQWLRPSRALRRRGATSKPFGGHRFGVRRWAAQLGVRKQSMWPVDDQLAGGRFYFARDERLGDRPDVGPPGFEPHALGAVAQRRSRVALESRVARH